MATTPTEKIAAMRVEFGMLDARFSALVEKVAELLSKNERLVNENKELREQVASLDKQNAIAHRKCDEVEKKLEKWDHRIWAFIGAILTLAAGLIVTLSGLRK